MSRVRECAASMGGIWTHSSLNKGSFEGHITDFFSYTSLEITKKSHTKSHKITIKSHRESTKNHKSLKNY